MVGCLSRSPNTSSKTIGPEARHCPNHTHTHTDTYCTSSTDLTHADTAFQTHPAPLPSLGRREPGQSGIGIAPCPGNGCHGDWGIRKRTGKHDYQRTGGSPSSTGGGAWGHGGERGVYTYTLRLSKKAFVLSCPATYRYRCRGKCKPPSSGLRSGGTLR